MCGHFFDITLADINLDSRADILMTINSGVYGELVVYQIPDDFRFAFLSNVSLVNFSVIVFLHVVVEQGITT